MGPPTQLAAYRDHALLADPPLHGQNRSLRVRGQSQKITCLFGKMLINDPLCGRMFPRVGDGRAPPLELGIQILQVTEAAPQEEVLPDIAVRPLDFAFRIGPIQLTSPGCPSISAAILQTGILALNMSSIVRHSRKLSSVWAIFRSPRFPAR